MFLKMHLFRGISPKCVLTPQKETSCHIFEMAIFSKFFGDFMIYDFYLGKMQVKKIRYFVTFVSNRSLYSKIAFSFKSTQKVFGVSLYANYALEGTFFIVG
jgi:hypothetical protein